MQGLFAAGRAFGAGEGLTLRAIGELYGRSILVPQVAGTPAQVAERLEALFLERACDGFMISPAHLPSSFEGFVDGVVPELQRRGIIRAEYRRATLRDHLGVRATATVC